MYGYKKYEPVTLEAILSRVTQEQILSIVFKEGIIKDKGAYYKAPYRNDNIAGCWFEEYNGKIYFVDYADSDQKPKDCFQILKKTLKLSFYETLCFINSHFSLGLGDDISNLKEIILNDYVEDKTVKTFKERVITFFPRKFNDKDRLFWKQYEISKQNLIDDKVFPVEIYRFMSRKDNMITIRPFDICYAYTDFPDGKIKIYRPYGNKETKWLTNCNQNNVGSFNTLIDKGELLIITKSYKDCRVLKNVGLNCIWFQNEGMFPNNKILKDLCSRFDRIVVWFDNDRAGITNGRILVSMINEIKPDKAKAVFLPPKLLLTEGIKDPSDLVSKKGNDILISFLINKKLLNES